MTKQANFVAFICFTLTACVSVDSQDRTQTDDIADFGAAQTAQNPAPWTPTDPQPQKKHLIVLAGQSNAFGVGQTTKLTYRTELQNPYPGVVLREQWHVGQPLPDPINWTFRDGPLQDRGTVVGQPAHQFGPELSMMQDLDAANPGQWVVAKFVVGGSNLATQWRVDGTYPSDVDLFDQLSMFVQDSLTEFDAQLDAIVWVQGGSDATTSVAANQYAQNLETFIGELRLRLGAVRFIFDRLSSQTVEPYTSIVRTQQEQVASDISDTIMVNADDIEMVSPHYSADGLVELGDRFAQAVLQ